MITSLSGLEWEWNCHLDMKHWWYREVPLSKNFGILQTNSMGVIDESYCGDNDEWRFPALAMRDTVIEVNDRICQFRIIKHQDAFEFEEVNKLDGVDRGGFGSTG